MLEESGMFLRPHANDYKLCKHEEKYQHVHWLYGFAPYLCRHLCSFYTYIINIFILYVDIINMHDICNLNKLHVSIHVLMLHVYIIDSHIYWQDLSYISAQTILSCSNNCTKETKQYPHECILRSLSRCMYWISNKRH